MEKKLRINWSVETVLGAHFIPLKNEKSPILVGIKLGGVVF